MAKCSFMMKKNSVAHEWGEILGSIQYKLWGDPQKCFIILKNYPTNFKIGIICAIDVGK